MTDVVVVVGGIVPDEDAAETEKTRRGGECIQPGASLEKIVEFIRGSVKQPASLT